MVVGGIMKIGGGDMECKWEKWNVESIMVSSINNSCSMGVLHQKDLQGICKSGGAKNLFFPSSSCLRYHYVCHQRNNLF